MTDSDNSVAVAPGEGRPVWVGRRRLMLGAAAAGAGAAVGLVAGADPASAAPDANGGAVKLGKSNTATATTSVTTTAGDGLQGSSSAGGAFAGVLGENSAEGGFGVRGFDSATEGGTGVVAESEHGLALLAQGNAEVTGTLSKGGGSFKIDHPLDPAGKYLYHSFVESPDMMNVYNGTVTLDGAGKATVALPDWFEALNRDFRYQLTAVGSPAPNLHVSQEVNDGRFRIAGGRAGQKVSWQVTGIRQDAWANANRIPVEADKPAEDRGRYLHPGLFGGEPLVKLARLHRPKSA
jgi:hypothetical protein